MTPDVLFSENEKPEFETEEIIFEDNPEVPLVEIPNNSTETILNENADNIEQQKKKADLESSTSQPICTSEVSKPTESYVDLAVEIKSIKELMESINKDFEMKLQYDAHKDAIIDKLHAENQVYKNDVFKKLVTPFVNKLIMLYDTYSTLYSKYTEVPVEQVDTAKLLRQFGLIVEDIEDVLSSNGVEIYSTEGEAVDFSTQKIIKTVPTDDATKDKTVAERLKKGFVLEGKIIRQEQITCYKFENK